MDDEKNERVILGIDLGLGDLCHLVIMQGGRLIDFMEHPRVLDIPPIVFDIAERDKFPIPEQPFFFEQREKQKAGVNLHVGRHGEMPIPSGQRKKLKRWRRK